MKTIDTIHIRNLLCTFESRVENSKGENRALTVRMDAVRNVLQRMVRLNPDEAKLPAQLTHIEELITRLESNVNLDGVENDHKG